MARRRRSIVVVVALCTALVSLISGIARDTIPEEFLKQYPWLPWVLLAPVVGVLVWSLFQREQDQEATDIPADQLKRNRHQMIARVRHDWIEGVLHQSLYNVARIELGLVTKPDAVEPLSLVVQRAQQEPELLPAGTRLSSVFDQQIGQLLILGAPGSGKTTLLLELAEELLNRAELDEILPIPVVFNLSSWAVKGLPLGDWLRDEIQSSYNVPLKIAEHWIDTETILPLLDGLDEVAAQKREACVEAVNNFHSNQPLLVCSREADYAFLTRRLSLAVAVRVQPLSHEQVRGYLEEAGEPLKALQTALETETQLWELLDTPLMLSIAALAYQRASPADLVLVGSLEARHQQLFARYIHVMFDRRGKQSRYSRRQTLVWLRWLGSSLVSQRQSVFHLEDLRPDWLSTRSRQRWARLLRRLVEGLVGGLVMGLLFGPVGRLGGGPLLGLLLGLSVGLGVALVFGLFDVTFDQRPVDTLRWSWQTVRSGFKESLVDALYFGMFVGLLAGLGGGLFVGPYFGLYYGLLVGLFVGLFIPLYACLTNGFIGSEVAIRSRPNEGTRRSQRNAVLSAPVFGLFGALVHGLFLGLFDLRSEDTLRWPWQSVGSGFKESLVQVLYWGLFGGLSVGLGGGLVKGGDFVVQHFILRFLLWKYNHAPLRYVRFLEFAKDLIFLRRIGGGYIFTHRLLLEYFAALTEDDIRRLSAGKAKE